MEAVFLILVICGTGFIFIRSKRRQQDRLSSELKLRIKKTQRPTPDHRAPVQSSTFDADTATKLDRERVLSGAAYVTDGDTITIKKTQIRLFGIDAPELNHPYGQKAKWALHKLCKGKTIRAEIIEEDDYGRTVAHCYLPDGTDLSAEMVKLGLAIDWPKFSGGKYLNLETPDARKRLFLADARQKGRMFIWKKFEEKQSSR